MQGYMHPSVHYNTVYNSQDMKAAQVSIDKAMDEDFVYMYREILGFLHGSVGKESDCNAGELGLIPGSERPLEEGMATLENTPVFVPEETPRTEELGRLHSTALQSDTAE